ncbi:radical SAM family heme chaperone HemW [Aphanothece sacrum]|uniref:Heme chaperone HemW n=1 Tax=Aphanothece sacrum FPU1 TaxID=1920663 RepID=A0A401IKX1_APHSA|nr:radical SAM family heme chaperone HemW [Aphanothece sacrum]GBF81903.1 coproporphyrinogen III oxidase [Aphanothece sacrum FPU1]GBF83533.1 coproporphyrinogen III oxidase [Aphanothece sacrum FPU3]
MQDIGIPTSAYLHIPFCRRRCYYCDFPISVLGNKTDIYTSNSIREYVTFICQEISLTSFQGYPLKTIFFGGGTPSLLPPIYVEKILQTLDNKFGIVTDAEISLEIDPGTFTIEQLHGYQQCGVNRVSLGVQAFQDNLLEKCGRFHRVNDILNAIEFIHEVGIKNFSLDLISGLPEQTLDDWQLSLETAISLAPNHLSCYDLVLESVTAFGKQYQPGKFPLPTDEMTAQMYKLAQSILTSSDYEHYEISNYAKQGHQCLHNRVYWQNQSYYGFGMGAASYTNQQRFTRPRTRQTYYDWVQKLAESDGIINCSQVSTNDILLETLMLGLRLKEGVDLLIINDYYGSEIIAKIIKCCSSYAQQGWVNFLDNKRQIINSSNFNNCSNIARITLSDPEGFLFSNTILATLFETLES